MSLEAAILRAQHLMDDGEDTAYHIHLAINDALLRGRKEEVDQLLSDFNAEEASIQVLISILVVTRFPSSEILRGRPEILKNRPAFRLRAFARIRTFGRADEAALLAGL